MVLTRLMWNSLKEQNSSELPISLNADITKVFSGGWNSAMVGICFWVQKSGKKGYSLRSVLYLGYMFGVDIEVNTIRCHVWVSI